MLLISLGTALAVFLTDWKLKRLADEKMKNGRRKELLGGRIVIRRTCNKGMMLNALEHKPGLVRAIRTAMLAVLTVWFLHSLVSRDPAWKKIGLAIVTGGAWNNVMDQLKNGGVTDYISFGKSKVVYNLSDFALFGGCLWLLIRSLSR